jgi:hypothetical protein
MSDEARVVRGKCEGRNNPDDCELMVRSDRSEARGEEGRLGGFMYSLAVWCLLRPSQR